MKKSLVLCFLFIAGLGFAQNNEQKAQKILQSVSAKYKSFKSIKALFTITIENGQDKSKDVQAGTLYLKGSKYKLEIAGQDVISDGKTRWTYVKDANEVQIDNQKTDENSISPTNIFTIYEKGWNVAYVGEQKGKTDTYDLIELIPVDPKSKNIFKVKLSISRKDKMISSAKVFTKNGNTQTITVEKLHADAAADDAIYTFNSSKYPGSEIVDLR
jgi:outer membrane lipoprotein carrier protein